tara:strand:- start:676 stop:927 length:252 start_codon:yes stop_codon:yes gene_type:complete
MKFNKVKLLPLVAQLGDFLKEGFEHYVSLKAAGMDVDPDIIALVIEEKMKDWNPMIGDKVLLDPDTRTAAARFVGGVAFNLAQ